MITKHWREIFDPTAQIFLNSTVMCKGNHVKITASDGKKYNTNYYSFEVILSL
jgi:hypothetical protein